jgi:hypothetical protein
MNPRELSIVGNFGRTLPTGSTRRRPDVEENADDVTMLHLCMPRDREPFEGIEVLVAR